ncbi:P-loop containing nucleoside triphosphate hydrolase [Cinara cedri]|uniref:P-loop containing nucleoside triphosphate hydrolase n=1 Tax=Cinara cedri TaxID=506608 RepID=A0A5E4N1H8_9HEMI|nr:P-loop containing nucleoside triphosphate hydrolase [Cinara cedri]
MKWVFFLGFECSLPIQQRAIRPMIKVPDVIAEAQSDSQLRDTQVLCLSLTREFTVQIQKVRVYLNIQCHVCIDGTNFDEDIRKLNFSQHIVSGTPEHVFDMI